VAYRPQAAWGQFVSNNCQFTTTNVVSTTTSIASAATTQYQLLMNNLCGNGQGFAVSVSLDYLPANAG
jgi:hypothetical protein